MMSTEKYTNDLILALRMREVPGERIGEVVAEVASHVAETGEDPKDAFGSPTEYAKAVAPRRPGWNDPASLLAILLGAVSGWLLAQSAFSLVTGDDTLYGAPTWAVALVALALVGLTAVSANRRYDPVVDPRSGSRLLPGGGWPTALVLVASVALVAAVAVVTRMLN